MKLAIIGAGEGSRLKSEGVILPKPLVKIAGECMIDRIIRIGAKAGVDSVHCILNENSQEVVEHLKKNKYAVPLNIKIKNTKSSLHSLFELNEYLTEPFLMATVDSIFKIEEYLEFVSFAKTQNDFAAVLGITSFIDDEKPLCVTIDNTNKITSFSDEKQNHEWATGGVYYFKPEIFSLADLAIKLQIKRLRNFLKLLLMNGSPILAYKFSKIIDVDHLKDITTAKEFLNQYENKLIN